MLLGRGFQVGRIQALLAGAREQRGGALVLRGDAGIGKTALLDAAADRAPDFVVLRARGAEAESPLAFGCLRDLLEPLLDHRDRLARPQADALDGALRLGPPHPGDRFA